MRLHYALLAIAVTFIASSDAVLAANDAAHLRVNQVNPIETVHSETRNKRMLRTVDTNKEETNVVYHYPRKDMDKKQFIEHRLQKALSDPKKTAKMYEKWYKNGYSAKAVAKGLDQHENRELDETYRNLAKGYAAYVKQMHPQQETLQR